MKTFQEFLEEGKKKKIEKLAKKIGKEIEQDIARQTQENPDSLPVADYGNPKMGSNKHMAAIQAMMDRDSAWRKEMKKKQKQEQEQQQNDNI